MPGPQTTVPAAARAALDVLDWRRRTHELYRSVRDRGEPLVAHGLWREGRDVLFAEHPASPLRPEHRGCFAGLPIADYDERYRFEVTIEPASAGADTFEATTGTDGVVPYARIGMVRLPTPDGEARLDVWQLTTYGGGLFVPLRDATSGDATYGGGRYLLDTIKGADLGEGAEPPLIVVDLNFAYNPSCAYDPQWDCPLAPAGNTTAVPVPVGEQHRGPWAEY